VEFEGRQPSHVRAPLYKACLGQAAFTESPLKGKMERLRGTRPQKSRAGAQWGVTRRRRRLNSRKEAKCKCSWR
jgi:hypothetical protein